MSFIRAYLRASTDEQDALRAKQSLKEFVDSHQVKVASWYTENVSGTSSSRPELDRLIGDSSIGDVLLIEKMDRLTRLPFEQWQTLKARIQQAGLRIVVLDQPMTHQSLKSNQDQVTGAIQQALTAFMLDLGAAMARDDYETRRVRQKQGIEKAKERGLYKGRPVDNELHNNIKSMLSAGMSYTQIHNALGCSRVTISKVKKSMG
ncbi:resolvase [Vibrio lentus]|uniref:recombinase family protein n=1 Tax=Vibrio lentus TaxID=136468 RepID=UPI000C8532FD|nr:recombinase family protein [Vibrio lentus]PMH28175.1 resolvase [Vibrio lentus]PMK70157.1 resolvase [Vibrio lentus]